MSAFHALLAAEIKLQNRAGFLFVIVIVTSLWFVILKFIPEEYLDKSLGLVLSLDISSVALLSCIGLHLLDVRLRVLDALLVAPVNIALKILARIVITGLLAALAGLVISLPYVSVANLPTLFFICLLNSLLYGVAGSLLAVYQPSISRIFVSMGLVTPIWLATYLPYLGLYTHDFLVFLPSYGATQMFIRDGGYVVSLSNLFSWITWFVFLSVWLIVKYRPLVSRC